MAEISATLDKARSIPKPGAAIIQSMDGFGAVLTGLAAVGLAFSGFLPVWLLPGIWPIVNLSGILGVAALGCALMASIYATLGAVVPQNGADYLVSRRVIGQPVSFIASWAMVLAAGLFSGWMLALVPLKILPFLFGTLTKVLGIEAFREASTTVMEPQVAALIGAGLVLVVFMVNLLPAKVTRIILISVLGLGIAGWVGVLYQFGSGSSINFAQAYNTIMGRGSYYNQVDAARSLGLFARPAGSVLAAGLSSGLWIFFGFFMPVAFAGEIKQPRKNLLAAMLIPLAVCAALVMSLTALMYRFVTPIWLSASSYLYQQGQAGQPLPWAPFFAAIVQPSVFLVWLAAVAALLVILVNAQVFFAALSRTIQAWGHDGLLPDSVGLTHPKTGAPLVSLLVVAVLAMLGMVSAVQGGEEYALVQMVILVAAAMLAPAAAVIRLPLMKKNFPNAPACLDWKLGPLPVLSLLGGLGVVFLLAVIGLALVHPNDASGLHVGSLAVTAGLFLSGAAWYFGWKAYQQRKTSRA